MQLHTRKLSLFVSLFTMTMMVFGSLAFATNVSAGGTFDTYPPISGASVNAGPDQTILLPNSTATLSGSSSGIDGIILYYTWTKLSGSGNIVSPNQAMTDVTGLTLGTSIFRLTVTNNTGTTAYDDVNIFVRSNSNPTDCTINSFTANPTSVAEHTGATTISWTTSGCTNADITGITSTGEAWDRGVRDDVNNTIVYGPPNWDFIYGTTGFYSFTLRVFNSNTPSTIVQRTVNVYVNRLTGGGGTGGGTGGSGGSGGGTSGGGSSGSGIVCPFGKIGTTANCIQINIPTTGVRKTSNREVIKNLQRFLNWNLGSQINQLTPDGKWGAMTTAAIRLYQQANSLKVDGTFGRGSASKAINLLQSARLYK